eukprot:1998607-Pyramimonas_sp.AAC.1
MSRGHSRGPPEVAAGMQRRGGAMLGAHRMADRASHRPPPASRPNQGLTTHRVAECGAKGDVDRQDTDRQVNGIYSPIDIPWSRSSTEKVEDETF